ncbi:centromere protein T [Rhineura floridana]|uniref:centromere protein T n=1 Tax=Rhineura floridana TaxID=261503 RepID=UPI002AC86104|nr:centromere protein T [Rhineura floridana]
MATRRSLRKEERETPQGRRRSLRLQNKKERPFRPLAYQRPGASIFTDLASPRTLFKKVLETQPMASPLVPEKADFPKPVETVVQLPLGSVPCSNLEISLSDPAPKDISQTVLLKTRSKKKVRLSAFERALDEQLASNTTHSLMDNTSRTKSLQISLATPPPLHSAGRRGLVRRPKNYRGVTTKAFEEGIKQNLLQVKGSQSYLVAASLLSNDTATCSGNTEFFAHPQLSRQSGAGRLVVHSQLDLTRQSLGRGSLPPSLQTPWQGAESDMDVEGVTQNKGNITHSLLDNTSQTKSLQISLATPPPLHSAGKKGLVRRPKNYRGVTTKAFEEGIKQNLLQIKGSHSYLVAASLLSNDTATCAADTEFFAHPQLSRQSGAGLIVVHSQFDLTRQSLGRGSLLPSLQTPWQGAESDMDVGVMQNDQKEILTQGAECADGIQAAPVEKSLSPMEDQRGYQQDTEGRLIHSHLKEMLMPSTEHTGGLEAVPQEKAVAPKREQLENLHGNSGMEQISSGEHLITAPVRSSTPTDAEVLEAHPVHLASPLSNERSAKLSVKAMVAHIIKELDRSVLPVVVNQGVSKTSTEEESFPTEKDIWSPQRNGARTSGRHANQKNPEQLERPPTKEVEDGAPQEKILGVETEDHMVSEAEMDSEVEEMSEDETDPENVELFGKTPTFVRARAFPCTPLLSTPHASKMTASRSSKQPAIKQASKTAERAHRGKREPALPRNFVKNMFGHYARMPVAKDAFKAVESCVNLYFKHLSDDLEVYANHAGRKTIEPADLELLMRRQGLVTDKMPLNVLIERYMPLEYRKLLIPVATSGNKVIPPKPR